MEIANSRGQGAAPSFFSEKDFRVPIAIILLQLLCGVAVVLVQLFGTIAFLVDQHGWNEFLGIAIALLTCWNPLGTLLGALGAHDVWYWSWSSIGLVFLLPILVGITGTLVMKVLKNHT